MSTHPDDLSSLMAQAERRAVPAPSARLVWTAVVDVGAREPLGHGPLGERFIVPILGGRFWGGPGFDALRGIIRCGGADRQLRRPDGVKELQAVYEMVTDDGAVLTIDNQVLVDEAVTPVRYAMSRVAVLAPQGPHAWLNRRLLVGTLHTLRPERDAVVVRTYLMGA